MLWGRESKQVMRNRNAHKAAGERREMRFEYDLRGHVTD